MGAQHTEQGHRVLVVEDELVIAMMIEDALIELGAVAVGPVAHIDDALKLAKTETIDAAFLDVNIQGGNSYAVADILADRGIPFIFASGYSDWALAERHRDRPRLTKPYTSSELNEQLSRLLGGSAI